MAQGVVELTSHFQIHTVELPKYNIRAVDSASDKVGASKTADEVVAGNRKSPNQLENWALWFQRAEELDAAQLRELLPGAPYQKAIGILEMISRTPSQRDVYEARQKAIRDAAWKLHEARKEGLAEGREVGLAEGREEGVRLGQIQLLQQLLNEPLSSASDLEGLTLTELDGRISALQSRLQKN